MAGDVRAALYGYLASLLDTTASGLVGVFPDALPERVQYPAIVYYFEDISQDTDLDGTPVFSHGNIVVCAFSYDKSEVIEIIGILRSGLAGLRGVLGGICIGWGLKLVGETDSEYPSPDSSSKIIYCSTLTYYFGWQT